MLLSKIPLFTKDIDIFAHIFWVTLTAVTAAAKLTVGFALCVLCAEGSSHRLSRDQNRDRAAPERSPSNVTKTTKTLSKSTPSRLPVSGLSSPHTTVPPQPEDNGAFEKAGLWRNELFKKTKVEKKTKKADYICGQWYLSHSIVSFGSGRRRRSHINYLCVRYTSGCCVNCRCRSFVRFSRGRFVRLSHKALLYRAINTRLTVNQKT